MLSAPLRFPFDETARALASARDISLPCTFATSDLLRCYSTCGLAMRGASACGALERAIHAGPGAASGRSRSYMGRAGLLDGVGERRSARLPQQMRRCRPCLENMA